MSPLISIITVTKNCGATIRSTLESVKAIKAANIEYIIVDGVSTDDTLQIINEYQQYVDVLISERDTGIYNAMNKGIALANGKYILFINGDDELIPGGFAEVIRYLEAESADVISATTLVGSPAEPEETLIAKPWHLLFFNSIPHPSTFVTASLLKNQPFREDLRIASDYDFFLRAYLSHRQFSIVPSVIAIHQRGGASSDIQKSKGEVERVRRELLGLRFHAVNMVMVFYRIFKKTVVGLRSNAG